MPTPLPVIANVFRCALNYSCQGMSAVNVIHIQAASAGQTANLANTVLQNAWQANQLQSCQFQTVLNSISIIPLDGTSASALYNTTGTGKWAGTQTGDALVAPATLIKLTTGLRGRNHRGRIFLPFVGELATVSGTLTSTVQSAMATAWTAFANALLVSSPISYQLGVASYDRAHNGAAADFAPASTVTVETFLATQRRRQDRIRP